MDQWPNLQHSAQLSVGECAQAKEGNGDNRPERGRIPGNDRAGALERWCGNLSVQYLVA